MHIPARQQKDVEHRLLEDPIAQRRVAPRKLLEPVPHRAAPPDAAAGVARPRPRGERDRRVDRAVLAAGARGVGVLAPDALRVCRGAQAVLDHATARRALGGATNAVRGAATIQPSAALGPKTASQMSHWPHERLFSPRTISRRFISSTVAVVCPYGWPYAGVLVPGLTVVPL